MNEQVKAILEELGSAVRSAAISVTHMVGRSEAALYRMRVGLLVAGVVVGIGYVLVKNPPFKSVEHGEIGVRTNVLTGGATEIREGGAIVIPGLQHLRQFALRDQIYHPENAGPGDSGAFQSVEGLSMGIDLTVRYSLDPSRIVAIADTLPEDINGEVVRPAVQGVIYKVLTRYTVREIFSTKRAEIQQQIESELKPRLLADGILLKGVQMGKVNLPDGYRRGMEQLLAEELESEKMRFTLELKDKQVKEAELVALADKTRRETAAEATASEQIIAAKAQEEAMKHVLPFKQKQIEQRQLEAEAEKVARIKQAEGNAQARVIESVGEADSRRKLADVEAYRMDVVGLAQSKQMERDGILITKHPLLIQKALADKLSDKISVIIAPAPVDGSFIGSSLLGSMKNAGGANTAASNPGADATASTDTKGDE